MDNERQHSNQESLFRMFTSVFRRFMTLCICCQTNDINFEANEYQLTIKSDDDNRATDTEDDENANTTIEIIEPILQKDYINIHEFDDVFKKKVEEAYGDKDDDVSHSGDVDVMSPENQTEERYPVVDTMEMRHIISNRIQPATPGMKHLQQRVDSFRNNAWPLHGIHDAKYMAEAGFFCVGIGEQAECYFCSLRINTWEDPPSVEHVKLIPRCRFLRDTYSDDWIDNILFQRVVDEVSRDSLSGDDTSCDKTSD